MKLVAAVVSVVLAASAACHPTPWRVRARQVGVRIGAVGARVVAVVRPVAADPVTRAAVGAALAAHGPITLQKSVTRTAPASTPTPTPTRSDRSAPPPDVTVTRTQAPADVPTMRRTTADGSESCAVYATMDACTAACTDLMKAASWAAVDTSRASDPALTRSCNCLEEPPGRCPA